MILFLLLSISAIVALVVGLIKPEKVIRWGATRTRRRVLLITVPTILVSFIFASYFASKSITPEEKLAMDKKREEQQLAKEQEKKKKTEEQKIQQEKEKKEKEENERKQKEAKEKKVQEEAEAKAKKETEEQQKQAELEKKKQEQQEKKAQEEAEAKAKKEAEEQQKQAELEKKKQEQQEKKAQEELKKQEQAKEKEAAAFENKVEKVVNKKFGEKKVESIQINDNLGTENENDKIVLITAEGKEGLSNNYTKKGMWTDTVSILKDLSNEKNISEITFFYKYPLIDAYGNEKKDTVMKINLNRDTLDKINFDNFPHDNLPKISNEYWEHPAFNKK